MHCTGWKFMVALGMLALAARTGAAPTPGPGVSPDGLWTDVAPVPRSLQPADVWVNPERFRAVRLDHAALQALLEMVPAEAAGVLATSASVLSLPMPDGSFERFRLVESPVMAPELAAEFPEIRTYLSQGVDDPAATARFDITPAGFHAQVLSPRGAVYIDPHLRDRSVYASYYQRDARRAANDFVCLVDGTRNRPAGLQSLAPGVLAVGTELRTYKLAVAATAEYTAFHGGTVAAGQAAIVTAVNRVTGVYETECAIRLVLVANNSLLVYTNAATDPYTNDNGNALLDENQANIDAVIGSANYDIGHVFNTEGEGLAAIDAVCYPGFKAQGETGSSTPTGDGFYIDYVAHEMGHQFGAEHTFNSNLGSCNGNRNAGTAYEVGSGSSIMAYAGICSTDNLQDYSDPYFHFASFTQIVAYTTTGDGNSCPVTTATGNSIPTVTAGATRTIPKGTPFQLTASGADANGDTLTYCWEERDLGVSTTISAADNGSSPIFRSFAPTTNAWRSFPRLQDLLYPTNAVGEKLPTTSRTMNFRVTVRDNRAGGGGVNSADTQVIVATNAGPFAVTSHSNGGIYAGVVSVNWNVAQTTNASVNCTSVRIALSTNGGFDFPFTLAASTQNDGSETVALPSVVSTNARLRVEAVSNLFFAINASSFSVTTGAPTPLLSIASSALVSEQCAPANGAIDPVETVTVDFTLRNSGSGATSNLVATLLASNGVALPGAPQNYGVIPNGGGTVTRPFTFTAAAGCGGTISCVFQLQDGATNLGTVSQPFTLGATSTVSRLMTNGAALTIPAFGAASTYPSTILVTGFVGTLSKASVILRGLSHTYPDDMDILLVGPGGQNVMLLSDAGLDTDISALTLTFDGAAAQAVPDSSTYGSGTYLPSNYGSSDTMIAPAPAGPYGSSLSVFNGLNPNGTWSLYIQDDVGGDSGSLADGWSLLIEAGEPTCCTPPAVPSLASLVHAGAAGFIFGVTNAMPLGTNYVLATTNMLTPLELWLRIATNIADVNGTIVFTNATGTNGPQRFFRLQSP